MSFSTRNSYYLRISKNTVLPIYIYLDERHINWMSDAILQHVLSDLRPYILPKLQAEADALTGGSSSKKASVDTHRGDTYQFCYFIRKTEPHSVVIKTRNFRAAPPRPKRSSKPEQPINPSKSKKGKRKEAASDVSPSRPTRGKKRKTIENVQEDDEDVIMDDTHDGEHAATMQEEPLRPFELEIEDEEEKPKPILGLTYQGFSIYGHCLCVVVEPWPMVRGAPAATSSAQRKTPFDPPPKRTSTQGASAGSNLNKGPEPLFLPEDNDNDEPAAPSRTAGKHVNKPYLDQVLGVIEISDDEDDEMGGMMEFSQVLHNVGDSRAGAINDDEDMDGSVLFGDADEFREL